MKMHLPGRPPNEGARLLAIHIGRKHGGDVAAFAVASGVEPMMAQRLIDGEIIPGAPLAELVARATNDWIKRTDFQRRPFRSWIVPAGLRKPRAALA